MMKKLLLLTLMIICAIAVVACNTTPPATSTPQSQPPVESSESEESIVESQPESQPESEPASDPASDPESVVESTPIVYTITFEVAEGLTAPAAIQVEEGDVVTLPTHVGEYQVKKWINKATGEEFVGGEFTLCENVTLVAVIPAETQPY